MRNRFQVIIVITLIILIQNTLTGQYREIYRLNDGWSFVPTDKDIEYEEIVDSSWTEVVIPHSWNNLDIQSGDKVNYGAARYSRVLNINKFESNKSYCHEVSCSSIEKSTFILASNIWNMFDFSVPEWDRGGIKGRNNKGLITYDRKTKKDSYYWYKANWSEEPVIHLTGKRNNEPNTNTITVKAYCNFSAPVLTIDGKEYGEMEPGINADQFLSKDIYLKNGKYNINISKT